jgi:16S rRNA pseudouridine516 synthase
MATTTMRLDRLLANMGYGSRRDIHTLARLRRVLIDGQPVLDANARVALTPDLQARITVDDAALDPLPGMAVLLHKPVGVTCSHKESGPLIYDLLPNRWRVRDPQLSSIGRLDKDTSGLLLLTDDGALLHRVIAPKSQVAKTYLVTLDRPLNGDEAGIFVAGTLMLDGETKPLLPVEMTVLSPTTARVVLHEGRYHQVRRMFAAVGNHVTALHRETVGGLGIPDDLAAGSYRVLEPTDIAQIFAG